MGRFLLCLLKALPLQVLRRVKTYLQTLGRKIDSILAENAAAPNPDSKFLGGCNQMFFNWCVCSGIRSTRGLSHAGSKNDFDTFQVFCGI